MTGHGELTRGADTAHPLSWGERIPEELTWGPHQTSCVACDAFVWRHDTACPRLRQTPMASTPSDSGGQANQQHFWQRLSRASQG